VLSSSRNGRTCCFRTSRYAKRLDVCPPSYAPNANRGTPRDGLAWHAQAAKQAPDRQFGSVVADNNVELVSIHGAATDGDRKLGRVDERIAGGVQVDEAGREQCALVRGNTGNRSACGICGYLLERMAGAEIDAVGNHADKQEQIEWRNDRELDRRNCAT